MSLWIRNSSMPQIKKSCPKLGLYSIFAMDGCVLCSVHSAQPDVSSIGCTQIVIFSYGGIAQNRDYT